MFNVAEGTCTGQFPIAPHGSVHGDRSLNRVDDGTSPVIPLSPPIPLFGRNETTGYASTKKSL